MRNPTKNPDRIRLQLPDITDPITTRCIQINAPDDHQHIGAFFDHFEKMIHWWAWELDDDKRGKDVAYVWRRSYNDAYDRWQRNVPCGDSANCNDCVDIYPYSSAMEFAPYDPRTDPNLIFPPYQSPVFVRGADVNLSGAIDSDIFARIPFPDVTSIKGAIDLLKQALTDILELTGQNLFPRLKFRFRGSGKIQIYFLKILQGGKALITIDGRKTSARMVDLQSASILNPTTLDAFLGQLGFSLIAGTLIQEEIYEINIEEEGDHYIDITFIPNIIPPNFGWGGGIRKINLCGLSAGEPPITRPTPDGYEEWDGEDWQPIPLPQYPASYQECECENDMCNCPYILHVDPCTGAAWYKDGKGVIQNWRGEVGGSAGGSYNPSLPPADPELPKTSDLACYKANGAWEVLRLTFDAMFDTYSSTAIGANFKVQKEHPEVKIDNWALFKFSATTGRTQSTWGELKTLWEIHQTELQEEFLCAIQDQLDKTQYLTDAEIELIRDWDFDSPEADLDDALTGMMGLPETIWFKELASYYASTQTGACDCQGNAPTPEFPPLETGQFMIGSGVQVGRKVDNSTPSSLLAATPKYGTKLSERSFASTPDQTNLGPNDKASSLFFLFEATEDIKEISFEAMAQHTALNVSNFNAFWHVKVYGAVDANSAFVSLIQWSGDKNSNTLLNGNAALPYYLGIPQSGTYRYFLLEAYALIQDQQANNYAPVITVSQIEWKAQAASGGNYRAILTPLIPQDKTI